MGKGPLDGLRVVELAGIGPGPFAGMMLADMGADVIRVDRPTRETAGFYQAAADIFNRGRRSIALDLSRASDVETLLRGIERSDVLIEGFRPGVMERLGLGPDICLKRNPHLIYGRMTGWGQTGPYAQYAGHDLNYIALAGTLYSFGNQGGPPVPPLNLVGDFGGGGMLLMVGILCALIERQRSGKGQVIDAAMIDGAVLLNTVVFVLKAMKAWNDERGTNMLDTGAPFYNVYETADGRHISIGSIEPKFYAELLERTGLKDENLPPQMDHSQWSDMKRRFAAIFRQRTLAEWCRLLEYTDVCFAPVLTPEEAAAHPHNQSRGTFMHDGGILQPAPAPRFSRSEPSVSRPPPLPGSHTDEILREWSNP